MAQTIPEQLPINTFAGIFLIISGLGVLIVSREPLTSLLFVGIGLFFLMRALAQYRTTHDGDN